MDRVLQENRKRDEYELDISDNDSSIDSEEGNETMEDENDDDDQSETEDIEPLDQSTAEEIAAQPRNAYWSKDGKIEYTLEPFELNRRNSYRRSETIVSGTVFIVFHLPYSFYYLLVFFCYFFRPKKR